MGEKEYQTKTVFLTFDDGPYEPYTSEILDTLKTKGARASFFVCGKNAELHPEVLRRAFDEGHLIANHSYSHSFFRALTGVWGDEIERTNQVIKRLTGKESVFFRPPWGWSTPWLKKYLQKKKMRIVLWSVTAHDHRQPKAEIIAERILKKIKKDSVILLHDGCGTRSQCSRQETTRALPLIIDTLYERGYQFETVDKLF